MQFPAEMGFEDGEAHDMVLESTTLQSAPLVMEVPAEGRISTRHLIQRPRASCTSKRGPCSVMAGCGGRISR